MIKALAKLVFVGFVFVTGVALGGGLMLNKHISGQINRSIHTLRQRIGEPAPATQPVVAVSEEREV